MIKPPRRTVGWVELTAHVDEDREETRGKAKGVSAGDHALEKSRAASALGEHANRNLRVAQMEVGAIEVPRAAGAPAQFHHWTIRTARASSSLICAPARSQAHDIVVRQRHM